MKLNRRGLFGVAAGGLAAGPGMARDLGAKMMDGSASTPASAYPYAEMQAKEAAVREWTLQQLAKAKRLGLAGVRLRAVRRRRATAKGPSAEAQG